MLAQPSSLARLASSTRTAGRRACLSASPSFTGLATSLRPYTTSRIASSSGRMASQRAMPASSSVISRRSASTETTKGKASSTTLKESTLSSPTSTPSANPSLTTYLPTNSQIHVLPFLLPPDLALKRLNAFSVATSRELALAAGWLAHAFLPSIFPDTVPLKRWKMVYVPGWCVQADVTVEGISVLANPDMKTLPSPVQFATEFSYFPGTSSHPISHISCTPTLSLLPEHLQTYSPTRDLRQHDEQVLAIPFDTSPLVAPQLLHESEDLSLKTHFDHFAVNDPKTDVKWKQLDVTPLYLPFYLASYEYGGKERTLLLEATSEIAGQCEIHFPNPFLGAPTPGPHKPYAAALHKNPSSNPNHFSAPPLLDLLPLSSIPEAVINGDPKTDLKDLVATSKKALAARDLHDRVGEGLERWMDAKGRREVLRERSIGEVKEMEGVFRGRMVRWEGAVDEEEDGEEEE